MSDKIKVGYTSFAAGNAPMKMGIDHGLFSDASLEIEMIEYPRGGSAADGLAGGEVDVAVVSALPIIRLAARGFEPVVVMSVENENIFAIIGAAGVTSPDQLRGRTVGVSSLNDQDSLIMRRTLDLWELPIGEGPDAVQIVEFSGGRGAIWAALLGNQVAAMAATVPEPINAASVGLPILHDYSRLHEPYQAGSLVTGRQFADSNPGLLTALIRAQIASINLFAEDFGASRDHLRACTRIEDDEVLHTVWRLFGAAMKNGVPTPAPLQAVIDDAKRFDDPELTVEAVSIVDRSFIDAAGPDQA